MSASFKTFFCGIVAGATAMALADPRQGRRRRALLRDKAAHLRRVGPRWFRRMERGVAGPARGFVHNMVDSGQGRSPADLERTVVERVESELGHLPGLHLGDLNFNAVDGVLYVRGAVPDAATACRIINEAAQMEGVRSAISLMRTPDGLRVTATAGEPEPYGGVPRAAIHAEAVRRGLIEAFPGLTDADILASDGYIDALRAIITERTHRPAEEVRQTLDAVVLAAV